MNDVVVIDNAVPVDVQKQLEELCLGVYFPWHYHSTSAYKDNNTIPDLFKTNSVDTPFFAHLLYDNISNSEFFNMFRPIVEAIPNIENNILLRFKINLTMPDSTCTDNTHSFPHTDLGDKVKEYTTAIYYVNNSTGDTFIFNDDLTIKQRINPKAGRLVIFNGNYLHSGNNPKFGPRVVANINLINRQEIANNVHY